MARPRRSPSSGQSRAAGGGGPRSAAWSSRSGTINDSSYSSTAPKPLQPGQAPRGLLKEKSVGVGAGAGVPQFEQVGCSEKRRREPLLEATATPSPSLKAVATASARRPCAPSVAARRSTRTTTSLPSRMRAWASASSSRNAVPSTSARTNPAARSCAAASTSGRWAEAGRGKPTTISFRAPRSAISASTTPWTVSLLTIAPQLGQKVVPHRAQSRRK